MSEASILPLGTQVRVSDGTPRPPERFNKKLQAWKHSNYTGVITEYRAEYGGYTVQTMPPCGWRIDAYLIIRRSGVSPSKITAIPGAPLIPVKGSGMNVEVDVRAMFAQGLLAA